MPIDYIPFLLYSNPRLVFLRQVERELKDTPKELQIDVFHLLEDLAGGKHLSMPVSRPLGSIAKGLHELRLSGKAGEFRVFYLIHKRELIYILHAAVKKKQKIDARTIDLLNERIRRIPK